MLPTRVEQQQGQWTPQSALQGDEVVNRQIVLAAGNATHEGLTDADLLSNLSQRLSLTAEIVN
ncbi:MAG: hypothetical protein JNG88_15880 [Phycisphaerales bacterium]|nr:hypothetical protein [Phycisphaerales bacterium]